jgi:hypothetical protein
MAKPSKWQAILYSVHGDSAKAPRDQAWDAGAETKGATPAQLRKMSLFEDTANPELTGSYKEPHHTREGNTVVWKGVVAALGRLHSVKEVSTAEVQKGYVHLQKHYKQFGETAPKFAEAGPVRLTLDEDGNLAVPVGALRFSEPAETETFAAPADGKARFKMRVHSGAIMHHPWWGQLALDLKGMKAEQEMPVLREHDPLRIVGSTDRVRVKDGLFAEGTYNLITPDSVEVHALCSAEPAHPFQASMYAPPTKVERVEEGETAEVNGQTMKGPGYIYRKWNCREVSFCALGADPDTSGANLSAETVSVSVTVSGKEKPMADEETAPKAENEVPEAAILAAEAKAALLAEGAKEGAKVERERIRAIRALALPGQEVLAEKLIADGLAVTDAQAALLTDPGIREALTRDRKVAEFTSKRLSEALGTPPPQEEAPKGEAEHPFLAASHKLMAENKGMSAKEAMSRVANKQPELHQAFVDSRPLRPRS